MTTLVLALFFISTGAALHTEPRQSNPAHNAQDDQILDNKADIAELHGDIDALSGDITDLRDRVKRNERVGTKVLKQLNRRANRLQDRIAALEEGTASQEQVATLHTQLSTLEDDFQDEQERIISQLQAYSDANDEQVLNAAQQYADKNDAYSSTDQDDVFGYLTDGIDRLVSLLDPYFATDDRVDELEQENQRLRNTVSLLLASNDVDTGDVAHYMAANDLEQFRYTGGTCHVYTNAIGAKKVQCAN